MSKRLIVYAYNVRFGEAILVKVPERGRNRYILVDAGNWQSGQAGLNKPLLDALKDIHRRTRGKIDLYVMTHEHMDHVEGLRAADRKGCKFDIDTVWMTASSEPGYYDTHEDAREKKKRLQDAVAAFMAFSPASGLDAELKATYELNAASTKSCVDFIRNAGRKGPYYIYRGCSLRNKHPFQDASFRILAPEEDTSVYYMSILASVPHLNLTTEEAPSSTKKSSPLPPQGVYGGDFFDLIERMDGGYSESVYGIDKAGNDTSIVFELTWKGKRLLFTGDAEQESWEKMCENRNLKSVDFYKIGHHGSVNAVPPLEALEKILPEARRKKARAALSTHPGKPFKSIPDALGLKTMKARTKRVYRTDAKDDGKPVRIMISPAD